LVTSSRAAVDAQEAEPLGRGAQASDGLGEVLAVALADPPVVRPQDVHRLGHDSGRQPACGGERQPVADAVEQPDVPAQRVGRGGLVDGDRPVEVGGLDQISDDGLGRLQRHVLQQLGELRRQRRSTSHSASAACASGRSNGGAAPASQSQIPPLSSGGAAPRPPVHSTVVIGSPTASTTRRWFHSSP
jgi:hypothetical protein